MYFFIAFFSVFVFIFSDSSYRSVSVNTMQENSLNAIWRQKSPNGTGNEEMEIIHIQGYGDVVYIHYQQAGKKLLLWAVAQIWDFTFLLFVKIPEKEAHRSHWSSLLKLRYCPALGSSRKFSYLRLQFYWTVSQFNSIVWTYSNCSKPMITKIKMEQVENEVTWKYFAECAEIPIQPNSVGIVDVRNIADKERSVLGLSCLTSVWTANFYPSMVAEASRHGLV